MAYYSEDLVDEILASTDIVEVVNEYVPLKRRGANYLGLCPFHKEKTPSFTVSPDKQIYKCFGCGQGGSVIQFISKLENLDFRETLEFLAEKSNIDLERYITSTSYQDTKKDIRDTITRINKSTARYFYEALVEETKKDTSLLKSYLFKRQLDSKTVVRFGLGFGSKKEETLTSYLTKLGYTKEEILTAGVVSKNLRGEIYENFAGRLIFPILDTRDRVIGFGGRVLDNSLPKYVNSPENALYHKGSNLYGLNVAKKENITDIIIVEGYMDCVALHKSGITNAVASLGTALTEKQAKLLKKYVPTVILSYDQDEAGQKATLRAIDILEKEGLKVKVLMLDKKDAKDPDEYINKYGKERLGECLKKSISSVEYKITKLEALLDSTDFNAKVTFLTKVAEILSSISNSIEQEMYLDLISKKYNVSYDAIKSEIDKKTVKVEEGREKNKIQLNEKTKQDVLTLRKKQEEYILYLLLSKDKKVITDVLNRFKDKDFKYEDTKELFVYLKELNTKQDLTKINILSLLTEQEEQQKLRIVTEVFAQDMTAFNKAKLFEELDNIFKKYYYQERRAEILGRLNQEISQDEKQMLEIELGQILLKMAKNK